MYKIFPKDHYCVYIYGPHCATKCQTLRYTIYTIIVLCHVIYIITTVVVHSVTDTVNILWTHSRHFEIASIQCVHSMTV